MNTSEKKKIKWLFGQPEDIILRVIKLQRDLFFKYRAEKKDLDPDRLALLSLIKAAELFHSSEHPTTFKNPDRNLDLLKQKILDRIERHEIRQIDKKKKKRESKKKKKIMGLMQEIKIMREQGQSFQSIADYIEKYHRTKIHASYVSKLLHKVSND